MLEELNIEVTNSPEVPFMEKPRTPAWLTWLACRLHAGSALLAEAADVIEWFGVDRTRQTVENWYGNYTEYCDQEFMATPDRVAVDEKQIQIEEEQKVWLYAAIDCSLGSWSSTSSEWTAPTRIIVCHISATATCCRESYS